MSKLRIAPEPTPIDKLPLGPGGRKLCRWCKVVEIPKGRRAYCSEECRKEQEVRRSPQMVRYYLKERDRGVCAMCGCDTEKLKRVLEAADKAGCWTNDHRGIPIWMRDLLWHLGFNAYQTLWEADHIHPVHQGGGECGLDNYQTLCVPCHKMKTKAQRRAASIMRPLLAMIEQTPER
jgi:5-methylcytosine-specific restriction enzyme A